MPSFATQPADPAARRICSSSCDLGAVLVRANGLARAARHGAVPLALRGKNIGLVCASPDDGDAQLLRSAAAELGAHVAHVRPSLTEASSAAEVADTARLLGRLYDAIDFHGASAELVNRVGRAAGVPVFDGIASARHPIALLARQLDADVSAENARRFVLQALLLTAMS